MFFPPSPTEKFCRGLHSEHINRLARLKDPLVHDRGYSNNTEQLERRPKFLQGIREFHCVKYGVLAHAATKLR
ncbi:unnamed protein product [Caenorhabditis sp. 36 PRJEB53466]|nr:unnamed protein product [Caenorhabditis sp. 36 PRJEB53466]